MIVLVFPSDLKTLTKPSIIAIVPSRGFHPLMISHENQIPNNKAKYTCLVLKAKIIATTGGITDKNPYSIEVILNCQQGTNF